MNMIAVCMSKNQENWDEHLPLLTAAYQSSEQKSTGYSPNMLMLGQEVTIPVQLMLGGLPDQDLCKDCYEYLKPVQEQLEQIYQITRKHTCTIQEQRKQDYDT